MDKPKTRNSLAGHPQLEKIIKALLDGKSSREIATWTRPKVSYATISRYACNIVRPSVGESKAKTSVVALNTLEAEELPAVATPRPVLQQEAVKLIASRPVLAVREQRLAAIQDRHDRMMLIVKERGEEMKDEVAGGASGFLLRDYKGKDADRAVYKTDAVLLAELREHEKHMAIECGEWQERVTPNVAIQIVMPTAVAPSDPLSRMEVIDIALPDRPGR